MVKVLVYGTSLTSRQAMTLYEYVITFDQEVNTVWRRKWTLTSFLLISIRGMMVLFGLTALPFTSSPNSVSIYAYT